MGKWTPAQIMINNIIQNAASNGLHGKIYIHLTLGELSDVDPQTFHYQWTELVYGTPLEHAQLNIRLIPAEVQCMACFSKYRPVNKKILCPHCGSFGAKILSGEEFRLESIETECD